ncbi:MAG: transglutaminase domain-containing protein [Candidatus Thorarchaeota archaeon]
MSAATTTETKRKIGAFTILTTLVLIAAIVWGTYTVILIQGEAVRTQNPHERVSEVEPWEYNINWAGGRSNWFDDINYTDLPLDQQLPQDLLQQMNNTLFLVEPVDPAQLWRSSAYDRYDGSGWDKTQASRIILPPITQSEASAQGNTIYTIYMNITIGQNVEAIELPALFPTAQIIEDSFRTVPANRIISYDLETDVYDTVLFSPLLQGETGESILLQYEVTYEDQDLTFIAANALDGSAADPSIALTYTPLPPLTPLVTTEIDQFRGVHSNAYETAVAVDLYFRSNYQLLIDEPEVYERPTSGQEVTDWFIQRGGGLPMDFATAYCVFMRDLGIPARMTMGYALGDDTGAGYRDIKVRHMMFWSEVYIPLLGGGGDWIQVIPISLPPGMGGGEIPENVNPGNVSLFILDLTDQYYAQVGDPFILSAILVVDGVVISTPETIHFYDRTDAVDMGSSQIELLGLIPMANITHIFPADATVGFHNISATWFGPSFSVTSFTLVYAIGSATPFDMGSMISTTGFTLSEIIDLDIKLGLDNHTTVWDDTVHVHGVMTDSGGDPVNGSKYDNDQVQIMWDEGQIGSATIGEDGTYQFDIYIDGSDLVRMSVGAHNLWAWYLGGIDLETGFPLGEGRSGDNSTITVWAAPGFSLTVNPPSTSAGTTIRYEGILALLNGTLLPAGETVGIIFNGTLVDTTVTNATSGYRYDYFIPISTPDGIANTQVNWTSSYTLVRGATSASVPITLLTGGTSLSIDSVPSSPQVVHPFENITIFGNLLYTENGSGVVGRSIDIYWDGSWLGSNTTGVNGYYEFTARVNTSDIGIVTYYSEFISGQPNLRDARSSDMTITVRNYQVVIDLLVTPNPGHILETVSIQVNATVPDVPMPLQDETLTIWWQNSTGVWNLTSINTDFNGQFSFDYQIPLNHEFATVSIWANYTSPYVNVDDSESNHFPLQVTNYNSILTIFSNRSYYHLNESAYIWGQLTLDNGTAIGGVSVTIHWDSGNPTDYIRTTNSTGWFNLTYSFAVGVDSIGPISVSVDHISGTMMYNNSFVALTPSPTLQLYQLNLAVNVNTTICHLDESFLFSGTLSFVETGTPIAGATITIFYQHVNNTIDNFFKVTDGSGNFAFQYNCSLSDALGAIYVWANFTSLNPLWDNALSPTRSVSLISYVIDVSTFTNSTSYLLHEVVHVWGQLTYNVNGSPLPQGQVVRIYWHNGTLYYFDGFYASINPLTANGTSFPGQSIVLATYQVQLVTVATPNPVYLNETVMINAHLAFAHNGSDMVGYPVEIWWSNGAGPDVSLITLLTNDTGWIEYFYSGMDDELNLNVNLYATYAGSAIIAANASPTFPLTLQRWTTSIIGFNTGGVTTFYITETVTVFGNLYITDLGLDPLVGVTLEILVNGAFVDSTQATISDGSFVGYWTIPDTFPTGPHDIRVQFVSPMNWIADSSSGLIFLDIQQIQVDITASGDFAVRYLGETLTISGSLTFGNGSAMDGYEIEIMWNGPSYIVLDRITITDDIAGTFVYPYLLPWDQPVGAFTYFVRFVPPSALFENNETLPQAIEIRDLVTIQIDPEPTDTIVFVGGTLTVSGYVSNGGGDATNVPVEVLSDSNGTGFFGVTDANGDFSIQVTVPTDAPTGVYNISVWIPGNIYYDLTGPSGYWTIQVYIESIAAVAFSQMSDIMPGESFSITVSLTNEYGRVIVGDLRVFLGSNLVTTLSSISAGEERVIIIPNSWSGGSGLFICRVAFDGASFVTASEGDTNTTEIHVFDSIAWPSNAAHSTASPATQLVINVAIRDDVDIPIVGRELRIYLNNTNRFASAITDENGVFSFTETGNFQEGDEFRYQLQLIPNALNQASDWYIIDILSPFAGLETGLLIFWAIAIGIEIVVAMLLVARHRYSGNRFRFTRPRIGSRSRRINVFNFRW